MIIMTRTTTSHEITMIHLINSDFVPLNFSCATTRFLPPVLVLLLVQMMVGVLVLFPALTMQTKTSMCSIITSADTTVLAGNLQVLV